jgi:UDP-N-acetylglucosamine diphosphorylase/glucosamine-1-phosphate N-acetyltransferase
MTQCTFFSDEHWKQLYPFSFPHQIGKMRWGAFTLEQLWIAYVGNAQLSLKHLSLSDVQQRLSLGAINDRWIPDADALLALSKLEPGQSLNCGKTVLFQSNKTAGQPTAQDFPEASLICHPTDFFLQCGRAIESQTALLQTRWDTQTWDPAVHGAHTVVIGDSNLVFMAPGARAMASTLNTENGPIFIGPNAEIQEGSHIRGPFILDEGSIVKMGSRVYGPTAIGPQCRIGGEVSNSVFLGYSNKGHDGFVGNSVIGQWCNLGADTNTSNLKNNYSSVRLWDAASSSIQTTDLQFCGLIMGDHSKCAINTMFNTGTIIGAGSVLVGSSFIPKHVPPFSWGGDGHWTEHRFDRFVETETRVMERRQRQWENGEEDRWKREFEVTSGLRSSQS